MLKNIEIRKIVMRAIDLHVHIGPEIIPRKFTSVESLVSAETGKIGGMALKNHFYPTQPFIAESNQTASSQLRLIGGVVLNTFQGGLNPNVIYANALLSGNPTIVWFPTISAKEFLQESEFEIPPEWVQRPGFLSRKSTELSPVEIDARITEVLKMIQACGAILATGHISWNESVRVIKEAVKLGITKIIVTHPIYDRIRFPVEEQKKLAALGAKMEHCYSMYSIDKIPIERIAEQIKSVGAENCILSSDVGQKFSSSPSEALFEFAQLLNRSGITKKELEIMMVKNPSELITKNTMLQS